MWTAPVVVIVVIVHLVCVEFTDVLIKLLHFGMPSSSTHVVKLVEIIGVVGVVRVHIIIPIIPLLILIILEALPRRLTPLGKWIFFYFLKNDNSVTICLYNNKNECN